MSGVESGIASRVKQRAEELTEELTKATERKAMVIEIFRIITGETVNIVEDKNSKLKVEGYKYSIRDKMQLKEDITVEFTVESTRTPSRANASYEEPIAVANNAFLDSLNSALIEEGFLRHRLYTRDKKICQECGRVIVKEFGIDVGKGYTVVYIKETYRHRCDCRKA